MEYELASFVAHMIMCEQPNDLRFDAAAQCTEVWTFCLSATSIRVELSKSINT
jgi:hypothetical protein